MKYYSSQNIRKTNATYYMIFGERSNGKTYDILNGEDGILWNYVKKGEKGAYIRRFHEDIVVRTELSISLPMENGQMFITEQVNFTYAGTMKRKICLSKTSSRSVMLMR